MLHPNTHNTQLGVVGVWPNSKNSETPNWVFFKFTLEIQNSIRILLRWDITIQKVVHYQIWCLYFSRCSIFATSIVFNRFFLQKISKEIVLVSKHPVGCFKHPIGCFFKFSLEIQNSIRILLRWDITVQKVVHYQIRCLYFSRCSIFATSIVFNRFFLQKISKEIVLVSKHPVGCFIFFAQNSKTPNKTPTWVFGCYTQYPVWVWV